MADIEQIEWHYYITPDGIEHNLADYHLRSIPGGIGNLGMPTVEWQTTRGPYQHGETVQDYRLRPRTVQLQAYWTGCSRAEYWRIRSEILDIFRPNRSATNLPGRLRTVRRDGSMRDLNCYVLDGPVFPQGDPNAWHEWAVDDTVRLIAFDPILFDPAGTITHVLAAENELVFPINPFILWGPMSMIAVNLTIPYAGTWREWPTLEFVGPLEAPLTRNVSLGLEIGFNYSILGGRTVLIDLTPGRKTVTDDLGNNLLAYISEISDLAEFRIECAPIVAGGLNMMYSQATGVQPGVSEIRLNWKNRYLGV